LIEEAQLNPFEPTGSAFKERLASSDGRRQCMDTLEIEISKIEPGMIKMFFRDDF